MTSENKDEFGTCPFDSTHQVLISEMESHVEKCAARRFMGFHISECNRATFGRDSPPLAKATAPEGEHAPGDGVQFPRTDYSFPDDDDDWITVSGTSDSDNSFFVGEEGEDSLAGEDRRSPPLRRQVMSLRMQPPPPPPPSPAPLTPPPVQLAVRSESPRPPSDKSPIPIEPGISPPQTPPPQETILTPDGEKIPTPDMLQGDGIHVHQNDPPLKEIPT